LEFPLVFNASRFEHRGTPHSAAIVRHTFATKTTEEESMQQSPSQTPTPIQKLYKYAQRTNPPPPPPPWVCVLRENQVPPNPRRPRERGTARSNILCSLCAAAICSKAGHMRKNDQPFDGEYGLAGPLRKCQQQANHLPANTQMAANGAGLWFAG
jgi:hypothetical protein